MTNNPDIAARLNTLEQHILIVTGDIRATIATGGDPRGFLADDESRLGAMLEGVLALKQLLAIPSVLTIAVEDAKE